MSPKKVYYTAFVLINIHTMFNMCIYGMGMKPVENCDLTSVRLIHTNVHVQHVQLAMCINQGSHRISGIKFPDFSMIFPEFSRISQH